MAGFISKSGQVNPGDPVTAGVANQLPRNAFDNTQFLKDIIDTAGIGQVVIARNVRTEPDAVVGSPLYLNPDTSRFERGLAGVTQDPTTLTFITNPAAQVWGVVRKKCSADTADVTLFGLDQIDISSVTESGTAVAGTYYLSQTTPGFLTSTTPPLRIPVLRADGLGKVFVQPQWRDLIEDHIHYRFELVAEPAGFHTPPFPDIRSTHTIDSPDSDLPGWLPASDPIFAGKAPASAKFGYNLSQDPALNGIWPPIPLESASLVWSRGNRFFSAFKDPDGAFPPSTAFVFVYPSRQGEEVQTIGPNPLAIVDQNGIWWMSDCYGEVPWSPLLNTPVSASSSGSVSETCPEEFPPTILLYFIKPNVASSKTVVTSLRSTDSRVIVECFPDGAADVVGDLQIRLNLDFASGADDLEGFLAFKEFDPDTNQFNRGPVVERIVAGTSISIVSESPAAAGQGVVTINADVEPADRELNVTLVRLDGVTEEFPSDVQMLGFPAGILTSYRAKINVPSIGLPADPQLRFRFRIMGRVAGTLTELDLTARRIPAAGTPVSLPTIDTPVVIATDFTTGGTNEYQDVTSDPFDVEPGDVVVFSLTRDPAGDGYSGEIDIIQQVGLIEPTP